MTEHTDFESSPDAYHVKLASFEGPLDLLLHLIRKHEVNIYDIPIALITEQYLSYLGLMQEMDLGRGGGVPCDGRDADSYQVAHPVAASRPVAGGWGAGRRSARSAHPAPARAPEIQGGAELLHDRETLRGAQFGRPDASVAGAAGDAYEPELEVDLFSLMAAFRGVLERAIRRPPMVLPPDPDLD